jgi:hypothetical protein
MDKKVVIGITVALLLIGAVIIVYGGSQLASKKVASLSTNEDAKGLPISIERIGSKNNVKISEFPTLPEGGNEIILGIVIIVGGILLYGGRKKILKPTQ